MPLGLRCAVGALFLSLAAATTATAQDEQPGGWTDPPVRGAADNPPPAESTKPAAEAPKPAEPAVSPPEAASASRETTDDAPSVRTARRPAAKLRRDATRRAVRPEPQQVDETPARRGRARTAVAERPRAISRRAESRATRRVADTAAAAAYRRPERHPRLRVARRLPAPADRSHAVKSIRFMGPIDDAEFDMRQGGWDGDPVARRIARAQAAGFLVLRWRTVLYPDGSRVRTLGPLEPGELD